MKNYLIRLAAFMGDFCDLKDFYKRDSSCPIPTVTKQVDLSEEEISQIKNLDAKRNPDSEKVLNVINTMVGGEKFQIGEYGFTETSVYSILNTIENLKEDSEVKEIAFNFLEENEEVVEKSSKGEERLLAWKDLFDKLKNLLLSTFGAPQQLDPEKEKLYAQVTHSDSIDSYKNEVSGCVRPGKCCVKCDVLIECPVPESICSRVQKWALETRGELAKSEGYEDIIDFPGFDPQNLTFTSERIPWLFSKTNLTEKDIQKLQEFKQKDPELYQHYMDVVKRKQEEKEKEINPYDQKAEELKLDTFFPGLMEWHRAMWQWLMSINDKQIPILDDEGNPIPGRFYRFSDKEQNIKAPDIQLLLKGYYPEPTKEEMENYIKKVQKSGLYSHSEKGKSMSPEEIFKMISELPGLSQFSESLRDYYQTTSYAKPTEIGGAE